MKYVDTCSFKFLVSCWDTPIFLFVCPSTIQVVATLLNSEMLSSTVYWISGNMLRSEETLKIFCSCNILPSNMVCEASSHKPIYSFQNSFVKYFINKCLSNSFIFCSRLVHIFAVVLMDLSLLQYGY